MAVCKNVLRDEFSYTRSQETIDLAYIRANELLNKRKDIKNHNCTIIKDSLQFDPRGPTASMNVHCEVPLKGRAFKGGSGFYFSVYRQDADHIEINEENSLQ